MAVPIIYKVVSEFKFEVADAIISADALKNKVEQLSDTANTAVESILSLGSKFALEVSGLGGGLLNFFTKAIFASDKFRDSQLSFANIISSNMDHLTGSIDTFGDRMLVAKGIMKDISDDAQKFGLPAGDLLSMTKSLAAELAPKGLAGTNFEGARTLGRNFLKSAPNLNIDPTLSQGQLLRAIEGSASLGDTLFKRLLTEAPEAFAEVGIKGAKGASEMFNKLGIEQRFAILNKAMAKFASDVDILSNRANLLSVVWGRIQDLFTGFASILKPLGDVIIPPLVEMLNMGIEILQTQGKQIVNEMARFIKPIIENPRRLLLNLMQLKELASDLGRSAAITGLLISMAHIKEAISFIGGTNTGKQILEMFSGLIGKSKMLSFIFSGLDKIFTKVAHFMGGSFFVVIGKVLGVFGLLSVVMQAISRAQAMARLEGFMEVIKTAPIVLDSINRIKEAFVLIIQPITDIIDGLSQLIAVFIPTENSIAGISSGLSGLAGTMEFFAAVINTTWSAIRAVFRGFISFFFELGNTILDVFSQIRGGNFAGIFDAIDVTGSLEDIGMDMLEEFMNSIQKFTGDIEQNAETSAVVRNVVNIGKVENNFDIKEQVEPDRIAFTIEETLNKVANNPTRASGRSLKGAFRTGQGVNKL